MWIVDSKRHLVNLDNVIEIKLDGKFIVAIDVTKTWHYIKEFKTNEEAAEYQEKLIKASNLWGE